MERFAFKGLKALSEILIRLLPDRKLKTLLQRPLNSIPETKDGYSLLLFWYWEECLKQRYERFVNALDESSKDMLPELKDKALKGGGNDNGDDNSGAISVAAKVKAGGSNQSLGASDKVKKAHKA
ncbi:Uncharacterized protein Rs2_23331 [Raphanus sativus]|nr:Uncharacterized protein Rs2_23331 [Raphanus sativus]